MEKEFELFFLFIILVSFLLSGCQKAGGYLELRKAEFNKEAKVIREAAVAGSFYPADKSTLNSQIDDFLNQAQIIPVKEKLRILIVPHAGYSYSGQVAAWGFKQIKEEDYKRVILIGPSHRAYFDKAAVWDKGVWQTPLGEIEVDEDFTQGLISGRGGISADLKPHLQEHSLELELPFLQRVVADFKLVPILLSHSEEAVLQDLSKALVENFDDQTLLVVSSDLSHYPSYEIANKVDKETIEAILSGDIEKFEGVVNKNLDQPGVDTCACGAQAIQVGMLVAEQLGFKDIKLLKYENSGDVGGDKGRVVGYGSIGFYGESAKLKAQNSKPQLKTQNLLNPEQQKKLLEIARKTLESFLKDGKMPEFQIGSKELNQKLGVFVTLRKDGHLRGCIGEFEPKEPLYKLVQAKAIDAAVNDPRFQPLQYDELDSIKIEISVLSPREKIDDWRKIELGKHGVMIKKGLRGGTFLPQVADETGWDLEEFLSHLCQSKAGLPSDCYKDPDTEIFIYTAQVFEEE